MGTKLHTKYKIRAAIPAKLVAEAQLKEKARELGLQIVMDASGNVEGAWDSSLLTLDAVTRALHQIGLRDFMIQRSMVSFTVAAEKKCSQRVLETIRIEIGNDPETSVDVLTDDIIFRFVMPCAKASSFAAALQGLGLNKIITQESYELEIEKTNA